MKKPKKQENQNIRLRDDAEKKLAKSTYKMTEIAARTSEELIQELRIHQIELEMMNEELRRANLASEAARDRYADLYDFAPVGYFTFTRNSLISEVNLTGASMLGVERGSLINKRFGAYVSSQDTTLLDNHLMSVLQHGNRQTCDLKILCADKSLFHAQLDSIRINSDDGKPLVRCIVSDITDRLDENKKRYLNLLDNANIGIYQFTQDGKVLMVNPEFARMFGYESPEVLCAAVKDVGTEIFADPKRRTEIIRMNSENPALNEFENLYRRKDGSTFWGQLNMRSVMDSDGNILYIEGFIEDISKRRQTEEEIRKSRQILQIMIDANPEMVLLTDSNGVVLAANLIAALKLGKTIPEIIGGKVYDLLPPDIAQNRWKAVEKVIETDKITYFEDQSGEKYFINAIVPISDDHGHVEKIFIMAIDITERKQIEIMLRQSRERYFNFIENMNEGFAVFNKNMEVVYVNDQFCKITGYEREEMIGGTIFHHFDENNKKILKEQFMKRRNGESAPYQIESIHKDGSKKFLNISPKLICDSENLFQGSFAVINDVTPFVKEHQSMKTQIETTMTQMILLNQENQEYNYALKVLLKNGQKDQKTIEENVLSNVREMVVPFFDKLQHTRLSEMQKNLIDVIGINLNNIVSPFIARLKAEMLDFTPTEIHVANLIREGRSIKDISDILTISDNTVMFHRTNIRRKLGLQHQKINLRTYLISLK